MDLVLNVYKLVWDNPISQYLYVFYSNILVMWNCVLTMCILDTQLFWNGRGGGG